MTKQEKQEWGATIQKSSNGVQMTKHELYRKLGYGRRTQRTIGDVNAFLNENDLLTTPADHGHGCDKEFIKIMPKPLATCAPNPHPVKTVGILPSASKSPISVLQTDQLSRAITYMQKNNFSQLPVEDGHKKLLGYISWRTILMAHMHGTTSSIVSDYMEKDCPIVSNSQLLLDAFNIVSERDFAIVLNDSKLVCGIVTLDDISDQCLLWTRAYILLLDIESQIRLILNERILKEKMQEVCIDKDAKHKPETLDELCIGDYVAIFANDDNWQRLKLQNVDKTIFLSSLNKIREIRNKVMHFRDSGICDEEETELVNFVNYLNEIRKYQ